MIVSKGGLGDCPPTVNTAKAKPKCITNSEPVHEIAGDILTLIPHKFLYGL